MNREPNPSLKCLICCSLCKDCPPNGTVRVDGQNLSRRQLALDAVSSDPTSVEATELLASLMADDEVVWLQRKPVTKATLQAMAQNFRRAG